MDDVVIVAALRTAVGKFGGTISRIPASELGAKVISALLQKTGVKPEMVSEVLLGQVLTAGAGQNPARQASIRAGVPDMVPAMTINKVCGSGLKATHLAAQAIAVNRDMGWDTAKVNVNGGAIAIGHPIGASGCRILVTLIHEMIKRDAKKGLASLCIGGGMGVALAIER